MLDDESEDDGSDSGSVGTCNFSFRFEESVGRVGDSVGRVDKSVGCVRGVGYIIFFQQEAIKLVTFSVVRVHTKMSQVQRQSPHRNILAPKVLIFPPSFKISFIAIFLF